MSAAVINLAEYTGKKVNVKLLNEDETFPAVVEEATEFAAILRRKGKSALEMHPKDDIEEIELQPEHERELKARRLDPVTLDNVKRHLIDRHGYSLASVNPMSPEYAYQFHNEQVDHAELGHYHAEAPKKDERDAAIEAAAASE